MIAKLDGGDAFSIKKRFDKPIRAIVGDFAQWEWDVTPLVSGIQKLKLYITGIIEIDGRSDRYFQFPVFEKEIMVKVNYNYKLRKFFKDHLKYVIGTVLALAAVIVALLELRKP